MYDSPRHTGIIYLGNHCPVLLWLLHDLGSAIVIHCATWDLCALRRGSHLQTGKKKDL